MTPAEVRVFRTLAPGGQLTVEQIQRAAGLTRRTVRRALDRLSREHLVLAAYPRGRWRAARAWDAPAGQP
ncbi:GntR family transcriptional regulator [Nocardia sp. alder85J]|uniref:GntR family transcriptional regulator n=1 Tax=Nocardia sp. alder85J TaxID=2862949 RepID=UPI001CD2EDC6|nr:GntR family transcriptional regulator [Nocardia sp. alder85J]MCX4094434.1 GntR family transcriptional regulator [Nocardia sp. alder85J]